MNIIDTLITNRISADRDRAAALNAKDFDDMPAQEQEEYLSGLKGSYTAIDLNRVTEAMEYLKARLEGYGYAVEYAPVEIEPGRTVWEISDNPTLEQMTQYLSNVRSVRDVLAIDQSLPATMRRLSYEGANEIERALVLVEQTINQVVQAIPRLAAYTFWSDNRPLPSAGSDLGHTWAEFDAEGFIWPDLDTAVWYFWSYGSKEDV